MQFSFLFLVVFILLSFFSSPVGAKSEYIGEDLGNNIYKRIDEGNYKLKKQLIERGLEKSAEEINELTKNITCVKKVDNGISESLSECFDAQKNFTPSELEDVSNGELGPIYTHMVKGAENMNTDQITQVKEIIKIYYQKKKETIDDQQKKLQEIGSIGLFSDGNKENSGYDLMVDLENIHRVIFSGEYTYDGTANMGAESIKNLLGDVYINPLGINSLIIPPEKDPGVTLIPPQTSTTGINLPGDVFSGIINTGSDCTAIASASQIPTNLDPNFLRDVQSQLLVGTSPVSSATFPTNGNITTAIENNTSNGILGGDGSGTDKFPCSGTDFYCILVSETTYTQNLLSSWGAATIEKILDENLDIANKFASSSFVQSKMTNMFFQLSLRELDLKAMIHIGAIISYLPPPILNIKKDSTTKEDDELNKILVGIFDEWGLDFKRQNSLEKDSESYMTHNLTYLTTDSIDAKSNTSTAPIKSLFSQAKSMEIKKSYGDSFNDDLFELHSFTVAFSDSIKTLSRIITQMNAIPQK